MVAGEVDLADVVNGSWIATLSKPTASKTVRVVINIPSNISVVCTARSITLKQDECG